MPKTLMSCYALPSLFSCLRKKNNVRNSGSRKKTKAGGRRMKRGGNWKQSDPSLSGGSSTTYSASSSSSNSSASAYRRSEEVLPSSSTTSKTAKVSENRTIKDQVTADASGVNRVGDYVILSLVGKGSFGKVFLARSPTGRAVAVKLLPKQKLISRRKLRLVRDEKAVMVRCGDHPFILSLLHSFQTKEYLCLVSEFCPGGELFYHLDIAHRFTESEVRFFSAEILSALGHLHKHRIAYRDLKSENLLLDDLGHIRLADFGLASPRVTEWSGAKSICGTPAYIAPEMIKSGGRSGPGYGYSVDYWSLGTLIYDFLCGQPPFYHPNMETMCDAILSRELSFPASTRLSSQAKDIIKRLLHRTPELRIGSSLQGGFIAIKEHPFFSSISWSTLLSSSNQMAPIQLKTARLRRGVAFNTQNFHSDFTQARVAENLKAPSFTKQNSTGRSGIRRTNESSASSSTVLYSVESSLPFVSEWDYMSPNQRSPQDNSAISAA